MRLRAPSISPCPLVALALLLAMVLLSRDFGATWDERALQKLGELIWNVYTGMSRPRSSHRR